jgi:hypothetical protein
MQTISVKGSMAKPCAPTLTLTPPCLLASYRSADTGVEALRRWADA